MKKMGKGRIKMEEKQRKERGREHEGNVLWRGMRLMKVGWTNKRNQNERRGTKGKEICMKGKDKGKESLKE